MTVKPLSLLTIKGFNFNSLIVEITHQNCVNPDYFFIGVCTSMTTWLKVKSNSRVSYSLLLSSTKDEYDAYGHQDYTYNYSN